MKFDKAILKAIKNKKNIACFHLESDDYWELTLDFIVAEYVKEIPYWETVDVKKAHRKQLNSDQWRTWSFKS
jgi:hypothetical protein